MEQAKSFDIPKRLVWEAYQHVRSRKGAGGVDEVTLEEYEKNLKDNLYKLWNRMLEFPRFRGHPKVRHDCL